MIKDLTAQLLSKKDLGTSQMQAAMEEIMSGSAELDQIVSFLTALSDKTETVEELAAAAGVLRKYATKIKTKHKVVLDTCGTGGDNSGTFNISTAAAIVAAACGVAVAKHGNRSVSSKCGSADVLETLGVNIDMPVETVEKCLDQAGITFLFAPNFHSAAKYAMAARRKIGKRTIFNLLGPLSNPATASHQLVGVYDQGRLESIARVLSAMGAVHALVVCGADGLDEITTTSATYVAEARGKKITAYEINPEDFGLKRARPQDLVGGSAQENARIILEVLKGAGGAHRDIVMLNAAAALYAADKAASIKEGMEFAREALDSSKALEKLEQFKKASQR